MRARGSFVGRRGPRRRRRPEDGPAIGLRLVPAQNQPETATSRRTPGHGGDSAADARAVQLFRGPLSRSK